MHHCRSSASNQRESKATSMKSMKLFAAFGLILTLLVPQLATARSKSEPPAISVAKGPWLYEGSDVPVDKSWTFGTLPNGLRYAVKKNDVPAKQVSIRVRIDAGALYEKDDEKGFAHLLEHLTFRGSTFVPDGEAKRIWQRFGATFGSDSNAQTTPTETVYKLDLPNVGAASLDESMKILSAMVQSPRIVKGSLDAERAIVLAEKRESDSAAVRADEATRAHIFDGQLMGKRPVIGTLQTLTGASVAKVSAFHSRWYRPENTVISIAGDADPAILAGLVRKYYANWKGRGAHVSQPDFGKPIDRKDDVLLLTEPSLPASGTIAYVRPWVQKNDTIAYNKGLLVEAVAWQIINRRLENAARNGGSFLLAEGDAEDIFRSTNISSISFQPADGKWQQAVIDIRKVLADALATPPSQADIDRERKLFANVLKTSLDSYRFEAASKQADDIVRAVDIRETVAAPTTVMDVYNAMGPDFTPDRVFAATKALFKADDVRIVLTLPDSKPGDKEKLLAAFTAPIGQGSQVRLAQKAIDFSALPKLGSPGKATLFRTVERFDLQQYDLSNGMKVQLSPNKAENDQIRMTVRFGGGYLSVAKDKPNLLWTGPMAWPESGIGNLRRNEIDDLTNGRRMQLSFRTDSDAFEISSVTRPTDMADQMLLIATKLEYPGWDQTVVERTKGLARQGLESFNMSAGSVLQRDLEYLLHDKDMRWKSPDREAIEALDLAKFRNFWEPLLSTGPVEISLFGDFDTKVALSAIEKSFGAMKPRQSAKTIMGSETLSFPAANKIAVGLTHNGPKDQAATVIAWPTGSGRGQIEKGRALEVLAAVFRDRLFEKFRAEQAASYSPDTSSQWPEDMSGNGYFFAYAQVKPADIEKFYAFASSVAADLAANPVSADELSRSIEPLRQEIERVSSGNSFWLGELKGATSSQDRISALTHLMTDYTSVTPAQLQHLAKEYLVQDKSWKLQILPKS